MPPLASYATVNDVEFASTHCANNVTFEHTTVEPPAYAEPLPSATVFQPKNVYPLRVGVTDDNVTDEPDAHT